MIQILKDNWYFVIAGAAVLLAAALFLNRQSQKRKREKEQYNRRMKDQVLNEALKNNLGSRNVFKEPNQVVPLEQRDSRRGDKGRIVLKLTVTGGQRQSYVVNPEEHVLIGSAKGMNDIILEDKGAARQHCDIFLYQDHIYVRNLNPAYRMLLKRKNNQLPVEDRGVKLLTGDRILIGKSRIEVTLMDYAGNTISG